MTNEERKAREIVEKYQQLLSKHIFNGNFDIAQQCALICVEEIIEATKSNPIRQFYWKNIKQIIENL